MLPSGVPPLVVTLLFVLPGFVQQIVRARLNGPSPEDLNQTFRVLRAIAISAVFGLFYLMLAGSALVDAAQGRGYLVENPRVAALLALLGMFAIPSAVAVGSHAYQVSGTAREAWQRLRTWSLSNYDPTPTAWDYAYRGMGRVFIRALTTDGRWIGGYFGDDSFASSFPQAREVFLEQAFKMSDDGSFEGPVHNTVGVYIRCDDIRVLEFVAPVECGESSDSAGDRGHTSTVTEGDSSDEG